MPGDIPGILVEYDFGVWYDLSDLNNIKGAKINASYIFVY